LAVLIHIREETTLLQPEREERSRPHEERGEETLLISQATNTSKLGEFSPLPVLFRIVLPPVYA